MPFALDGKIYQGNYVMSEEFASLLSELGIRPTEKSLALALPFVGKVLYKRALGEATSEQLVAIKAKALVAKALSGFRPAEQVLGAFAKWQDAEASTSAIRAKLAEALAQVEAIEKANGLPKGTMKVSLGAVPTAIATSQELFSTYASTILAQFQIRIKNLAEKQNETQDVIDQAKQCSIVVNSTKAAIDSASLTGPSRRKASNGGNGGNKQQWVDPIAVAGIAYPGRWSSMASALLAAGAIPQSNFTRHPAFERAAGAMKNKVFTFPNGLEVTGEYIQKHLDEFRVVKTTTAEQAPEVVDTPTAA